MPFTPNLSTAEEYDRWFQRGWGRHAFKIESNLLLRAAGEVSNRDVLDVGCGTGRLAARLVAEGANVFALDPDEKMLAVAKTKGVPHLLLGDAVHLPFHDQTFDVAFAVTVCEFVDDVDAVFSEMARVVRSGGSMVVGSLNPRSPWGLTGSRRFQQEPWKSARFLGREELLERGRRYGSARLLAGLYSTEQWRSSILELLGRPFPQFGAFQVLQVSVS